MLNIFQYRNGLQILPVSSSSIDEMGELEVLLSDGKLYFHNGAGVSPLITASSVDTLTNKILSGNTASNLINGSGTFNFNSAGTITTPNTTDTLVAKNTTDILTNKTIDASSNTISNLTNSNLSGSAGITGSNIASNTVANSNLAQMSADTIKGNNTGLTANASDLTGSQVTALLSDFIGDSGSGGTKGLVPAPAAGDAAAAKFLKADGTWQNVSGSGTTIVGTFDSQPKDVKGLVISGNTLFAQSADSSNPGMVTTGVQTLAGAKTFSTSITTPTLNGSTGGQLNINAAFNENLALSSSGSGRVQITSNIPMQWYNGAGILTSPTATYTAIYFKNDNLLYSKDTTGFESLISTPPGTIHAFGGTVAPAGYFLCNGSTVSRTTYANLFAAIGTAYGAGDGSTTFHLPDLRGYFLRGVDNGAGHDPDAASRTALNSGGNTGDNVGSFQADDYLSHTHPPASPFPNFFTDGANGGFGRLAGASNGAASLTGPSGGNETRPKNVNANFIIKI